MQNGPEQDVAAIGDAARGAARPRDLPVPLFAVHGESDSVVSPRNAAALVRQYLHLNGHASVHAPSRDAGASAPELPVADNETRTTLASGRTEVVREWRSNGRLVVRLVEVTGLGHAWSGGDASLAYNDAEAPDATALVGAFFADALS
jgi:poly(3-hydroxybutyrate) depolymerase